MNLPHTDAKAEEPSLTARSSPLTVSQALQLHSRTFNALEKARAVVVTDRDRRIKWVNQEFTRLTGYKLDEVLGKNPGSFLQFEKTDPVEVARIREALDQRKAVQTTLLNRSKDGIEYWLHLDIQPVMDASGDLIEFVSIQSDVTGQMRAQLQLQSLLDATSDGLTLHDANGTLIACNRTAESILGISSVELQSKPVEELFRKLVDQKGQEVLPKYFPTRLSLQSARPIRDAIVGVFTHSGQFFWLSINTNLNLDINGNLISVATSFNDITNERKQREQIQLIINGSKTGTWDWDIPSGRVIFNEHWAEMLGYKLEELAQDISTFIELHHPQTLPQTWQAVQEHLQGVTSEYRNENLLRRKDGRYCNILATGKVTEYDSDGKPLRMVGVHIDISETKHLEQEFKELSDRYRAAVSGTSDGLWDWNLTTNETWYSDLFWKLLGFQESTQVENQMQQFLDLVHANDLPYLLERIETTKRQLSSFSEEIRVLTANKSYRWFRIRGSVQYDNHRRLTRLAGSIQDIHSLKVAEQSLIVSREQAETALREVHALRTALDEHSLLSITDRRGKITDVNNGFCRISGYTRLELLGKDHSILNSGLHPKQFWIDVWRQIGKGIAWRGEVCNRRKDGTLYWVDSTIVPCLDQNGKVEKYVSIRFDITSQKAAETSLIAANARAEAASRAKSAFLANMSHEIRTPMTAIIGFAELLSKDSTLLHDPVLSKEYVEVILNNGRHLLEIINDILDVSKIEAGKVTVEVLPTNPIQVIRDVLKTLEVKSLAKGLNLELQQVNFIPDTIQTDPMKLRQILLNLVGNAIKFTDSGGITIRVSCNPVEQQLTVEVIDTGIGISEETLTRIFGAFEQANLSISRKFGGSGLGLNICKRLTEMLGGGINVRSKPDSGSTFKFWISTGQLPNSLGRRRIETQSNEPATIYKEAVASNREVLSANCLRDFNILVVEDGEDNQRLLSFLLKKVGANITIANHGREAVEILSINRNINEALLEPCPFDLMICDIHMPEMDGYETIRCLRDRGSKLKSIALTAHALPSEAVRCMEFGFDAYASKPIEREQLLWLCKKMIESSQPMVASPNV